MPYILTAGELLIDFTPAGWSPGNQALYEQNPGGAPANVAVGLRRLGLDSGFAGKVGCDSFGHFLKSTLSNCGVRTEALTFDAAATTLAFVHLAESGERSFSFYRNPGADTRLCVSDIDYSELDRCDVLHFGSLLFTAEPARSAMTAMLDYAKGNGKLISYDPNWRPALWNSSEVGLREMRNGQRFADIVKVSLEELFLLTEEQELQPGIGRLLELGVRLVLVTLGEDGCVAANRHETIAVPAFSVAAADTTGCGDSAMAGCLYKALTLGKAPENLDAHDLWALGRFANACGALCAKRRGAIPAMPTLAEVEELLR
jgi:fructokinase